MNPTPEQAASRWADGPLSAFDGWSQRSRHGRGDAAQKHPSRSASFAPNQPKQWGAGIAAPPPSWLSKLHDIAQYLASPSCPENIRVAVSLPTGESAAAVVAAGLVGELAKLRARTSLDLPDLRSGERVSVFRSGEYADVTLEAVADDGVVRFDNRQLFLFTDIVRPLPRANFPNERPRRHLSDDTVAAWSPAWADPDPRASRIHARVSATPIVVVGDKTGLVNDFKRLSAIPHWNGIQDFIDLGTDLSRWFRHPAFACGASARAPGWASEVTPAVVVLVGAAAWRSNLRRAFRHRPQLLLLDRRSEAAVQVVDEILLGHPEPAPLPVASGAGIEVWAFSDTDTAPWPGDDPDSDEDAF